MSKGRKPDFVVKVAVPKEAAAVTFRYVSVGAGWMNDNGWINFDVVTMPGVRFRLIPADQELPYKGKEGD